MAAYARTWHNQAFQAFETLADPMRRSIVELLLGGEQAVTDIVGRLDIHQSGVSRHLLHPR